MIARTWRGATRAADADAYLEDLPETGLREYREPAPTERGLGLIWAPSSAGAHWVGQEKAPAALRAAGLAEELRRAGFEVVEIGSTAVRHVRLRKAERQAQNVSEVVTGARETAGLVARAIQAGLVPFVVGGDCTLALGAVSALAGGDDRLGLVYLDGGPDLNTPEDTPTGILDSMGVAHMLGLGVQELREIGPVVPLLDGRRILFFGCNEPSMNPGERARLHETAADGSLVWMLDRCRARGLGAAAETAVRELENRVERFVLHFDVDVMNYVDFPASDTPQLNVGMSLEEATEALGVFAASGALAAIVVTEYNPDRDPDRDQAARLVSALVTALGGRLEKGPRELQPAP